MSVTVGVPVCSADGFAIPNAAACFISAFCFNQISLAARCSFNKSSNGFRLPSTFLLLETACV